MALGFCHQLEREKEGHLTGRLMDSEQVGPCQPKAEGDTSCTSSRDQINLVPHRSRAAYL